MRQVVVERVHVQVDLHNVSAFYRRAEQRCPTVCQMLRLSEAGTNEMFATRAPEMATDTVEMVEFTSDLACNKKNILKHGQNTY